MKPLRHKKSSSLRQSGTENTGKKRGRKWSKKRRIYQMERWKEETASNCGKTWEIKNMKCGDPWSRFTGLCSSCGWPGQPRSRAFFTGTGRWSRLLSRFGTWLQVTEKLVIIDEAVLTWPAGVQPTKWAKQFFPQFSFHFLHSTCMCCVAQSQDDPRTQAYPEGRKGLVMAPCHI